MNGRFVKWGRATRRAVFAAGRMASARAAAGRKTATGAAAVVLTMGLTVALAVSCQSPEERCLNAVQKAVYQDDFQGGLEAVNQFYAEHAEENEHPSEEVMAQRWEISAYARLCLLMTGELNRRFLAYYPVRELAAMLQGPLPMVERHCYAYARMYYEMGLYGPALPVVLWQVEDKGWSKPTVDLLFRIYTQSHQYRAAQTYWQALQQQRKTKRWSKPWHRVMTYKDTSCGAACGVSPYVSSPCEPIDGTRPMPLTDTCLTGPKQNEAFIDGYVRACFEHKLRPNAMGAAVVDSNAAVAANLNPYLTDYYTLICLLDKRMDQVPTLIKVYRAQNRPLPDYLQEAVLMYASTPEHAAALEADGLTHKALQLNPEIEERVNRVLRDFEMLKIGSLPFDEMTKRYAATYTYHLLFGQIQ